MSVIDATSATKVNGKAVQQQSYKDASCLFSSVVTLTVCDGSPWVLQYVARKRCVMFARGGDNVIL